MAVGVFQHDDRIVHERTDRQSQAPQGHGVDRVARGKEPHQRTEDCQRNRHHGDDRHSHVAQEDQDHHRHEQGPDRAFVDQALNRLPHVDRLIHHQVKLHVLAFRLQDRHHPRNLILHAIDHRQRAGALLAIDGDVHLPPAVDPHESRLNGAGVLGIADVGEIHPVARVGPNRNLIQLVHRADHGVGVKLKFVAAELRHAWRDHEVLSAQGIDDIQRRETAGLQFLGVHIHQNRAIFAAKHRRRDDALHAAKHVANLDPGQVLQRRLVQARIVRTTDRQGAQRDRGGRVERHDHRRQRIRRERGQSAQGQ